MRTAQPCGTRLRSRPRSTLYKKSGFVHGPRPRAPMGLGVVYPGVCHGVCRTCGNGFGGAGGWYRCGPSSLLASVSQTMASRTCDGAGCSCITDWPTPMSGLVGAKPATLAACTCLCYGYSAVGKPTVRSASCSPVLTRSEVHAVGLIVARLLAACSGLHPAKEVIEGSLVVDTARGEWVGGRPEEGGGEGAAGCMHAWQRAGGRVWARRESGRA